MNVKRKEALEDYREMVWGCARCNWCKNVWAWYLKSAKFSQLCPAYARYKFEAYSGQGKMHIARALLEGDMSYEDSDKLLDIVYRCTACGACEINCLRLQEKRPLKITELLRVKFVEDGVGPMPQQRKFAESVEKNYNPYFEPHGERLRWMPPEAKMAEKADTVYFVGCTSAYRMPHIAQTTVRLLNILGIDFTMLCPEEWCCGSPLLRTGQLALAKNMAEHNIHALKASGAKRVVFSCAGCYRVFEMDYKEIIGETPFEILHITELLSELERGGKIRFKELPPERVTYHDPCHLGRHVGVYEPPREILRAIPGIRFIEMERNRDSAWCCGAGGGVKAAFNDFALWSAAERLEEAKASEAASIISACPFCERNLRDAIDATGARIGLFDITEIVFKALGGGK